MAAEYGERGVSRSTSLNEPVLDRAVHLVGGDVQEAVDTDLTGDVAQDARAERVGGDERVGIDDRAIDVRLGGEVDDRVVARHVLHDGVVVADVALDEATPAVVEHIADVVEVAGVGELVEHGDLVVAVGQQPTHVVRADEACGARDEQLHGATAEKAGAVRSLVDRYRVSEESNGNGQRSATSGSSGLKASPGIVGDHSWSKQ